MNLTRISGIVAWLTALWVLLWGDITFANVASGLVVAVVVVTLSGLPRVARGGDENAARVSLIHTAYFVVYVLYKLVEANLYVAWEIVTPRNRINVGVVRVPLRTESEVAMMVVSNVITLTPGTFTFEVKGSPPVIYVNVLHLHDLEVVRKDLLHIEALSVRAFGSRRARAQLAGAPT